MHSNFSVQSTASRRSSAIRLGTSSLSPSTVAVGRTGTGTAADIQKAHQEKDILIANLSRERDLLERNWQRNPIKNVIEILSLKSDVETVKTELGRLQTSLALKDEEIEKWRLAADETKFKNSETADDRDRIVRFYVCCLRDSGFAPSTADATEKHRIELAAARPRCRKKTAAEDELRKHTKEELSAVVREKEEIKARLRDANGHLSQANQEVARLKSEYDHLDAAVREKRTVMTGIFKEFADVAGPQSFDEEIPVLKQLLEQCSCVPRSPSRQFGWNYLSHARPVKRVMNGINQLTIDLNSVKAERERLSGKLQAVNAEKSTIMTETDLLKQ
ncbi:hypothetical protein BV898_06715 [Hypsibius exemplaris]|uniref:Uncharacterized protein n=1 Tax=Hypsibius exemplaris TaxID=2072580 RepID=A0A1W0WVT1_HYPEX|nr:hypothetical protein BV898_06715 [Hypsibius exemplaris]